ncbi:CD209 antigen-like protein C isoform X2 [Ambystoma mexicanum]|uniref:CD209 antigen-like protein C isoform X2 n=1 Tax=Ambystoma mexicanum TaxID=8296 RepID=UPI0037E81334
MASATYNNVHSDGRQTARINIDVLVLTRITSIEQKMEQLKHNYTQSLMYIRCIENSSASECDQFLIQQCPERWVLNNNQCYFFSSVHETWERSQNICKSYEADLVIITDSTKQAFITKTIANDYFWIGLTDVEQENQWKWVDGSRLESRFWHCDQPDDAFGGEDCVFAGYIGPCTPEPGQVLNNWNDENCAHVQQFICEKKPSLVRMQLPL